MIRGSFILEESNFWKKVCFRYKTPSKITCYTVVEGISPDVLTYMTKSTNPFTPSETMIVGLSFPNWSGKIFCRVKCGSNNWYRSYWSNRNYSSNPQPKQSVMYTTLYQESTKFRTLGSLRFAIINTQLYVNITIMHLSQCNPPPHSLKVEWRFHTTGKCPTIPYPKSR